LRTALAVRFGLRIGLGVLERLLAAFDEALLLDDGRFARARERALAEYRQAPFRPPVLAGQSYPADADEPRHLLRGYLDTVDDVIPGPADGRGLVSPHIEYARGGSVYARVWKRAADMVMGAEREGQPCELVPILCGSFGHFVRGEAHPEHDPVMDALVDTLREATAGRRVIVVAAGDLSHVGPAFGGQPLDIVGCARLQAADDELIERICAGDAPRFFAAVEREGDRRYVCGLPPIYLALRILSPVQGERVAYDRCPADENGTSLVSVCGIVFK
jgi:predicted class III extradiol MEMO1 family dioxygenase